MVRWIRTAQIAPGKMMQAIAWSKEIAEFVKKYKEISSIDVFMDSFGDYGTVRWIADYDDLASLEKVGKQIADDQEYYQKVANFNELFVGSANDLVMRSL